MTAKESAAAPKKRLEISILLDYYGALLTERQREILDYYYNDDMSLSEIADETGITRQGVRYQIKFAENKLEEFEEKLGLLAKRTLLEKDIETIRAASADIPALSPLIDTLSRHLFGEE